VQRLPNYRFLLWLDLLLPTLVILERKTIQKRSLNLRWAELAFFAVFFGFASVLCASLIVLLEHSFNALKST